MKTKLVIIGVTGDLARRKLLPALEQVLRSGVVSELEIIGVSRREFLASDVLVASGCDPAVFAGRLSGFTMDLADIEDYRRLAEHLALSKDTQALLYLSVPPRAATQIVDRAGEAGLNQPNVKILFEKPFGIDLASAEEMIERTGRYFDESQIYRIDHYLAKEMAQDIIAVRGGNALFAQAWDNHSIERIEINATETLGVEGRGEFYEQTGALRDVVQGHLMQLLALTIMRVPEGFDWRQAPAFRAAALASLVPADPRKALWAQYEGYENDVGNPGSRVETFVQVELASRDPLWVGVPLILTTGKALPKKATEIHVYFRSLTDARSNRLTFRIQPSEGITMELYVKKPGYEREFISRELELTLPVDVRLPDAYEQVLVDAIRSHKSLFTSSQEVLESWRVLQPLLDSWQMDDAPLVTYPRGTWPANSKDLE